ncbi:MAG TPA: hypothetical protein VGI81_13860 [Tepidisphaeraceae bacterium]|jgi:hypothetical protein
MRIVWLIPVAYVAGIEGFGFFVPYLLFLCAVATLARMKRHRPRRAGGVALAQLSAPLLELEPAAG